MLEVNRHENIEILSYSEVKSVEGYVGNYNVTVEKKPRYVNNDCNGCGAWPLIWASWTGVGRHQQIRTAGASSRNGWNSIESRPRIGCRSRLRCLTEISIEVGSGQVLHSPTCKPQPWHILCLDLLDHNL